MRFTTARIRRPHGGRLVQDVRVLRGAQPDDRRRRPGGPGHRFRLASQDTKPGQINLNLIIDEEVFFSVFGQQDPNFNQQLLNFDQLPNPPSFAGGPGRGPVDGAAQGSSPVPIVVTATNAVGALPFAYPMNNVGVVAERPLLPRPPRMAIA